jgi:cubilin
LTHSLTFQLLEFDLESSENCTKDYVQIIDPVFNEVLWKGCGNQLPNTTAFKTKRNELTVRLVSDGTVNAKGFRGNYSVNCGTRIVTNDTGEIVYKGFSREQICEWSIISWDPSKHVTLSFKYLSIFYDSTESCVAQVQIFEGESSSLGPLKAEYCGNKIKKAIISNGNALTVKLNTTLLEITSEFDIHYSVLDNG